MGLGTIPLDQLNRTFILGEHCPSGCFQCYTDLDKDGAYLPGYIPVVGFHGCSWVDGLLSSTADVAIADFLLKEDDSTSGDPFLESKFRRHPKRGHCVTKCVREILVLVCDVPRTQVCKFGISSFQKLMPTIATNSRVIAVQTSVGGLAVSLKKTDLFLQTELLASSHLARVYFQTNTHPNLQFCRFARLCVFLSGKHARQLSHAEPSTNSLSLAFGIPFSLMAQSPLHPLILSTLRTVRVI